MQINYFPGRIRFRDHVLRDEDIRQAAVNTASKMGKITNMTYNERTASVLVEYDPDTLNMDKMPTLLSLATKLQAKVTFYTERKKADVISLIEQIGEKVESWRE